MIVSTKRGAMVSGVLSQDPKVKKIGGKDTLVLNVRAQNYKDDSGNWHTLYVDVQCRDGLAERDGMYQKGDFVAAEGREIEDRPGSDGKIYHNLTADDVIPGGRVIIRWMQQQINLCFEMIQESSTGVPQQDLMIDPESQMPVHELDDLERLIDETDEQDLPF